MSDSTPAGLGRSATDLLAELHQVGTTSPQPGASPALHAVSNVSNNTVGANLSASTTASSTTQRGRSNSALPKLSTSHFHAPWKFGNDSRNNSRHRSVQSTSNATVPSTQGKLLVHPPHLQHHPSSHLSKPLLRRPGVLTTSVATPAAELEGRLAKNTPAIEEIMNPLKLERERQRAEARNKEIDTVFQRISNVSSQATQKLDQVYYSILEKMAVLKSTLRGMQEIYDQAKGLSSQFEADANAVQKEVLDQAESFHEFKDQTKQIEVLETRIKNSKQKMDSLSDRLEAARERVRKLETKEEQVQKSISFQFRIAYSMVALLAIFFLSIVIINFFTRPAGQLSSHTTHNTSSITIPEIIQTSVHSEPDSSSNTSEETSFKDTDFSTRQSWEETAAVLLSSLPLHSDKSKDDICSTSTSTEDDPRLRLFDEL